MSDVNQLAAMLQSEPTSEETTGETEETLEEPQSEEVEYEQSDDTEAELVDEEPDELDEESDPVDYYTVKVDGEEVQVTLDEALKGYQRDTDYRKKTMSLAEQRKAVADEKARIGGIISEVDTFINGEQQNVDWETLKTEDPAAYIDKMEAIKKAKELKEKALEEQQKHFEEIYNNEVKSLINVMGGDDVWDQTQRNQDMQLASEYLQGKGFKDSDIGKIIDHKLWTVIFDAAKAQKFKETEAKVKEQRRTAPKSVKPGQKVTSSQRKTKEAKAKIRSSRRSQDQVAALAELLSQGK